MSAAPRPSPPRGASKTCTAGGTTPNNTSSGKDAAAGHQFISAGICSSVVRARRSAIEEETNFHEQHRSPEHIHAMPAGSHAIHGFKAYTAASRHERTTWMVVDEASERRHLASRSMIGQRPDIREQDVWRNIGENLSRQPQKASALDMLHRMAETPPQVQRRIVRHGAARA